MTKQKCVAEYLPETPNKICGVWQKYKGEHDFAEVSIGAKCLPLFISAKCLSLFIGVKCLMPDHWLVLFKQAIINKDKQKTWCEIWYLEVKSIMLKWNQREKNAIETNLRMLINMAWLLMSNQHLKIKRNCELLSRSLG